MTTSTIRPAKDADVPGMEAVLIAADGPTSVDVPAGAQQPYLRHLVNRGRVAVATDPASDAVIGFGAVVATGRAHHLADLFVRPDRQGDGIGRRLLDAVYGDAWPRTTFASDDPRALPLYIRSGMRASWPNLYIAGDPSRLPAVPGFRVEDATLEEVGRLEGRWAGVDRKPDLGYWSTLARVRPFRIRHGRQVVGAGFGRDRIVGRGRWVDQAVTRPGADGAMVLMAAMHAGLEGTNEGGACVPGSSPLVRLLLDAGFTIRDRDTFLTSDPSIVDGEREIVNTGFL